MIDENYLVLEQKVREVIEHRNETLDMINRMESGGVSAFDAIMRYQDRATEFEQMMVELGTLVGVECLQSDGK